jgi:hypothetical protein
LEDELGGWEIVVADCFGRGLEVWGRYFGTEMVLYFGDVALVVVEGIKLGYFFALFYSFCLEFMGWRQHIYVVFYEKILLSV